MFIPQIKEDEIEILTPWEYENDIEPEYTDVNSIRRVGTNIFLGSYQKYDQHHSSGAHVLLYGKNSHDAITANKITGVTFYYRNNKTGELISIIGKLEEIEYYGDRKYHAPLVDGYTPYKAIVKIKPRTSQEIYELCQTEPVF